MKITIVGAGRVGIHLAKYFAEEHQDVYLVDEDAACLAELESDFNMRTFVGRPTDFTTLRNAFAERADVFAAVTANTAENLVSCALARSMGARRTIARVDSYAYIDPNNRDVVRGMGVDHAVFPDLIAANSVISALDHPWCRAWHEFDGGSIVLVAVSVTDESPIAGKRLREIFGDSRNLHVSAQRRGGKTLIPRGDDVVLRGDVLYFTSTPQGVERIKEMTGIAGGVVRKVLLTGGSRISELVARNAGRRYDIVVIEKDMERCRELAENCPDCNVIYGDATREDVLAEAGIYNCDAFVALTDITEGNILSCLTARDAGVCNVIAEVEKEQFMEKAEVFDIGTIINKPILTANAVLQIILDADDDSPKCFAISGADVLRLEIMPGSRLTQVPVKDLKIPQGLTFAGLVRDGKGMIVSGMTRFEPGDRVILFCLGGSLDKVEKLFDR